jgi:PAS domain S-box-containing protein
LDPLTILLQLAYYAALAVSLWRFATRRGPLELAVVAIFAPIAGLFLLTFVKATLPTLQPVLRPALIGMLLLQPWFVVRLIDQIRPVSPRLSRLVLAGGLASTVALTLFTGATIVTLAAVIFFFTVEAGAAGRLVQDARRRVGVARMRIGMAAVATGLLGLAILLAGVASAASGGTASTTSQILTRLLALLAGLGYLVALVPPDWLRTIAYRALAFDLMRTLVAPDSMSSSGRLWADLADTAQQILGARRVSILAEADGLPLATAGERLPDPEPRADAPAPTTALGRLRWAVRSKPPVLSRVEVALRSDRERNEHLVAEIEGRPLFVEDDVALLTLLGSLTARAVDREEALITLGEARHAIEESAATKASEARFRALLEAEPNAILALDERHVVVWATRQAGELFGSDAATLAGTNLADLVAVPHDLRTMGMTDEPVFRADTTGRRSDGTHFPAEIARTTFEMDGQPFELAVVSDVSWRQEADQVRERFLGVLSHELRTPVTSIYGGTQLLLGHGARLDEDTRTELLVSVAAESERLQRMIENLVALARIERGAEPSPGRPVLIDRVIRDLIERERQLWPEVSIRLSIPNPVQMVSAEEEYVGQIIRNLLSNAAKYGGVGSTIDVTLEDSDNEVLVTVRDNGPGIAAEESDKLFSLYYRAAHQAAAAPGAGIGLFICRELVSIMGGRMWAKPRPEGGAEFGFSLPSYVDEPDPSYTAPSLSGTKPVSVPDSGSSPMSAPVEA